MLHTFLSNNREDLIHRCRVKVALRPSREASTVQLQNGVPLFLDQLIQTLKIEQTDNPMDSRAISGPASGAAALTTMSTGAAQHGKQLLQMGFTVDQVVHDYGDLCQAITDLAVERDAPFEMDEFRTLNRCLDNAIADAVTEFSYQRDAESTSQHEREINERLGFFAHELRNFLQSATLAFSALKAGNLNLSGATGSILGRSLGSLGKLVDQTLTEVRSSQTYVASPQTFSLAGFIDEMEEHANLVARTRGCDLVVSQVDAELAVSGNRDLLFAALANLLQNAFKFTQDNTQIDLDAYTAGDRILIDVKDHCGGLSPGTADTLFKPFHQHGENRTGLGLGLSIAKRSVEASDGYLTVQDVPGVGCVFTISLPRHAMHG